MRRTILPLAALGRLTAPAQAKLELLESFQLELEHVSTCAQQAASWLAGHALVEAALVAVVDLEKAALLGIAGAGVPPAAVEAFQVSLGEVRDPLVRAFNQRRMAFLKRGAADHVPLALQRFPIAVLPLGNQKPERKESIGLLLVGLAALPVPADVRWLADVLGRKLEQLALRGRLAEDERRFRRERTLLHTVINAVTDPIVLTDTEGRLVVANSQAEALFAATEDVSEGRRRAVELNNMFFSAALSQSALDDPRSARRELLLVDPNDGSDLFFELFSAVVEDPREGTGVASILRDITDLRRASQQIEENYAKARSAEAQARAEGDRLNLIIDSVADPILATDPEGKIAVMNTPAERLFTVEAGGGEAAERAVRANDAHFSSFIAGLLSSGSETTRRGDIGLLEPSTGRPIPYEAIAGKILSESGELSAVVTILHDRTEALERARLYEELKRVSEELETKVQEATAELAHQNELLRRQAFELEQASAAKSRFLANMSHELRTPLNAILGYASLTLQGVSGELTPTQRRNLTRIEANGRHLLTVINEILDITRIEAGRMPLQVAEFDVAELLREVTAELEAIISRSRLDLTVRIDPDLPLLRTDRQKVKQIVVNLLSNALKFTPNGSVTMSAVFQAESDLFALDVADTGIGIGDSDRERIFEDFLQVDNSPTRAYGGTGLGLSICRRLATMLRGSIRVESQLGQGSTFTLLLPRRLRK